MNKNYALLASGAALLASTAMTSGANAATVRSFTADEPYASLTPYPVATTLWGGATTSATDVINMNIAIDFTADLTIPFDLSLDITGGEFTGAPGDTYYDDTSGNSISLISSIGTPTIQVLPNRILITNINASAGGRVGLIVLSDVSVNNAAALNTAGTSVSVSGGTFAAGTATSLETINSANIMTSKNPISSGITASTALVVSSTTTVPFTGVTVGGTSAVIASINLTSTFSVASDIEVSLGVTEATTTVEVRLTHPILSSSAVAHVRLDAPTDIIVTAGAFQSGSVTFTTLGSNLVGATLEVRFNGSVVIPAASAGTISLNFSGTPPGGASGPLASSPPSVGGSAAAFNLGGLVTEINTAQPSINSFDSYVRITNQSSVAGAASITVLNGNSGVQLGTGTYTTASIAAGSTLQVGMDTIETALGITSTAGVPYTIRITGPFNGYVQHIVFNSSNGFFGDLSAFRQGGSATGTQNAP